MLTIFSPPLTCFNPSKNESKKSHDWKKLYVLRLSSGFGSSIFPENLFSFHGLLSGLYYKPAENSKLCSISEAKLSGPDPDLIGTTSPCLPRNLVVFTLKNLARFFSGPEEIRTLNPLHAMEVLYR